MKQIAWVTGCWVLLFFQNCTSNGEKETKVLKDTPPVAIRRTDRELFALKTKQELQIFLQKNPALAKNIFRLPAGKPSPGALDTLSALFSNPALSRFQSRLDRQFGDLSGLEKEFSQAFGRIRQIFPGFVPPKLCTTVTGFLPNADLNISDSLLVIGMDYFAGEKASFLPNLPQYQLSRYQPAYIVPLSVMAISSRFNQNDPADATLLADMVSYGKSLAFTAAMLPEAPDSLIIGYTGSQLQAIEANRKEVWGHYVKEKLFYSTDGSKKPRYVGERPNTPEISSDCPPRTGWWLGWQIVKQYLQKGHTLPQLMQEKDARKIFMESGYKGG
jgi:hypothetical protein